MNKINSNILNVIVNIQYGIGFELVEGQIELEITIFNITKKSRILAANRNRINVNEEFIWKVDRNTLKDYLTKNGLVEFKCFTTPSIIYGNICQRRRVGFLLIKLKEFQVIGHDWDQCVALRSYNLRGCKAYYALRVMLVIQGDMENLKNSSQFFKTLGFNTYKNNGLSTKNRPSYETESTKNKNIAMSPRNQENIKKHKFQKGQFEEINEKNRKNTKQYENILNKQEIDYCETICKCDNLSNNSNKENKYQKFQKRGYNNEQSFMDSRESMKTKKYNESKLSELIDCCCKHTDDWLKVMKKIKKEIDTNNSKHHSSNSSIKSDINLERPLIMVKGIKQNVNDLTEYMIYLNEKMKEQKNRRSRKI